MYIVNIGTNPQKSRRLIFSGTKQQGRHTGILNKHYSYVSHIEGAALVSLGLFGGGGRGKGDAANGE